MRKVRPIDTSDPLMIAGERPPLSVASGDDRPPMSAAKVAAILAAVAATVATVAGLLTLGLPRLADIPWPRLSENGALQRLALDDDTNARVLEYYAELGNQRPLAVDRIDRKGKREVVVTLRLPEGASLDDGLCLPADHALWRVLSGQGSLQLARAGAKSADLMICAPPPGGPAEAVAASVVAPKG